MFSLYRLILHVMNIPCLYPVEFIYLAVKLLI